METKKEVNRKKYYKRYYHEKKKPFLPGVSIKELAIIKHVNPSTIRRNLKEFDLYTEYKPLRIKFNDKVLRWQPGRIK